MEVPIPAFVPHPEKIYYKEVLLKKEARKTWTEYYAMLCDRFLIFNRKNPNGESLLPNFSTIIELAEHSVVVPSRKTCYRFPFYIRTDKLTYNFKCETSLQRYRWMVSIRLAIDGKPPEPPPRFIPTAYIKGKTTRKDSRRSPRSSRGDMSSRTSGLASSRTSNGSGPNSHDNTLEDESELNHSSTAIRLHRNKNALMLTNKGAFTPNGQSSNSILKPRKLSVTNNDLEIVDYDDDDDDDDDGAVYRDTTFSNRLYSRDMNVGMQNLNLSKSARENTIVDRSEEDFEANDLHVPINPSQSYRLYPDNMKSHSWTSLGITGHKTAHRQHSAPSTSQRNSRRTVSFSTETK